LRKPKLLFSRIKHFIYRFLLGKKTLTAYASKYNAYFRFYTADSVGRDIYYRSGVYSEDYINNYLRDHVRFSPNDIILDIGANIGWYSVTLHAPATAELYAFEPDPLNFHMLTENIRINGKDNVRAVNAAVGSSRGTMKLYRYRNYNRGRHSLIRQEKSVDYVEVPVITVDEFLKENGAGERTIRFIKLDIEGFEWEALKGAEACLRRCEWMLTEFTPSLMKKIGQDPGAYIAWLKGFGFEIRQITEQGVSVADFDRIIAEDQQVNLLCWRK